jgi:hypothetical protein
VRAYADVRRALAAGIPVARQEQFREEVRALLAAVEQMCMDAGGTPARLPAPTRNAYAFLKELDLDHLPEPAAGGERGRARIPSIRNLCGIVDFLSQRMWVRTEELLAAPAEQAALQGELRRHADTILGICERALVTPAELPPATRLPYAWLRFLSEQDRLFAHLHALRLAHAVEPAVRAVAGRPVMVSLLNMGCLWRHTPYRDVHLLKVAEGFLPADAAVWAELFAYAFPQGGRTSPRSRHIVQAFAGSAAFRAVTLALEELAAPQEASARGVAHDLEASFDRVNREYFGGSMPRPSLRWGRSVPSAKFGHYDYSRDTVLISSTLDRADVPEFVVDSVVFHELLHKYHGSFVSRGRNVHHTAQFSADARRFARHAEAEAFLAQLAARLRQGRG